MRPRAPECRVSASSNRSAGPYGSALDHPSGPGVHVAEILCDACGRITIHRIVRWDPRRRSSSQQLEGLAKCRECGWTHPFAVRRPTEATIELIVSRGAVSERSSVRVPASQVLRVGEPFPGGDPPLEMRKLEAFDGTPLAHARASAVRTAWAVPASEHRLRVSILEGARTRPVTATVDPQLVVTVGEVLTLGEGPIRVVALRAQGRTWKLSGDRFPARDVQRVYGRRTEMPPAGRSDWRREREMPRSRASSTSRTARSRSSPGVSRARISPHRRTAASGAMVQ